MRCVDSGGGGARRALVLAVLIMVAVAATALLTASSLAASPPCLPSDTLELAALQDAAVSLDPRLAQRALERRTTELRLRNLDVQSLPMLQVLGNASYQSEVTEIPVSLPGTGAEIGMPPKDRYEAAIQADWTLWDGGRTGARGAVEEARYATASAELDARLHEVRTDVSEAFFDALIVQERLRETHALLQDLDARLAEVRAQVGAGTALPGDTAVVRAELLGAVQSEDELTARYRASLDVLAELTGREPTGTDVLVLPELDPLMDERPPPARDSHDPETRGVHPRYDVFAARRTRLRREADAVRARRMPEVGAFGTLAFGSPGYAQFRDELHEYWRAGVQLRWQPWAWNSRAREIETLELQRRILDTEEQAFSDGLRRAVRAPLRRITQMQAALASDDDIIALRAQVERQARAQFAERAIPVSRYTDVRTDLLEARVARARHRIELARAQATYLLILGAELR